VHSVVDWREERGRRNELPQRASRRPASWTSTHRWNPSTAGATLLTIGLLIALSQEGLVEYVHHRHLVAEARTNIRQELEGDHQAAQKDLGLVQKNIETLQANIVAIHSL
jgi:hypothetical protein